MIKAIETEYNGYRFRSRLEARWAVFFDTAGIEYEYEPEGYDLGNGIYYLPDFYLPWFKCFVEIKPLSISPAAEGEAKDKLEKLFYAHEDCCVMLCKGDPLEGLMFVGCQDCNDSGGGWCGDWWKADFVMGGWGDGDDGWMYTKHHITLCLTEADNRSFVTANWDELPSVEPRCIFDGIRSDLEYAKKTARQARFEHGESPRPR